MLKLSKKAISSLLSIFLVLFLFSNSILANNDDININAVNTVSEGCILMETKYNKILYSKNADKKLYPASTTKLMTAILALENCKLTDVATVSHNAIFSIPLGYTHANLVEGEKLTIEQLLNVLLIPSANDAAIVLAEHISGSVDNFAKLMNEKAKEIGCKNTNFVNPNGIHDDNHYSTAYDLCLIGRYAMKFDEIMKIAKITQYTLPATNKYDKTDRIFNATNELIKNESLNENYYKYATGLKTGYTDLAGSCIVSTAKKDDMELIAVILNAPAIDLRYNDCKALFNYGFDNYKYTTLNSANNTVRTIQIPNATKETKNLEVIVKDDINTLISSNIDQNTILPIIEINSDLKAPILEGAVIGKITYTINEESYSSDLIAKNSVYPFNYTLLLLQILIVFIVLYIIYRIIKNKNKPHKSSKKSKKSYKYKTSSNNSKKKRNNYKNFDISTNDIHNIHKGKGDFKFTQINDYL